MRLYRVTTECRKCTHRHLDWINEPQRQAAFQRPPDQLLRVGRCGALRACGEYIPIFARHYQEAAFDLSATKLASAHPQIRKAGERPNTAEPLPPLTSRQAQVCALVVEGMTDRAIARTLKLGRPTVRQHISYAARKLCKNEPHACRALPRQTIVAYYKVRAGSTAPVELFQIPA